MKPSHAVVVRIHSRPDDEGRRSFRWRLHYFAAELMTRLERQSSQDFDILVRTHPSGWQDEAILALSPKIKVFHALPEWQEHIRPQDKARARRYWIDFIEYKHLADFPRYDIQTGIDSDDLVLRADFIETIERHVQAEPERSLHISFQPYVFDWRLLGAYECQHRYSTTKGSPMFSLYQPPDHEPYVHAYHDSHLKMQTFAERRLFIDATATVKGFVAFTCRHGDNSSTQLSTKAIPIRVPA
jgi:hypothetical protein